MMCSFYSGAGTGMQYFVCTVRVQESFEKHRSLAAGISSAGGGIGMMLISQIRSIALGTVGWQYGLLFELGFIILSLPFVFFLRDQPTELRIISVNNTYGALDDGTIGGGELHSLCGDDDNSSKKHIVMSFLKNSLFYLTLLIIFSISNDLFTTSYYLPSLARLDYGLKADQASLLIFISGVVGIPGRILLGYIGSYSLMTRTMLFFIVNLLMAVLTCLIQYMTTFGLLVPYAIVLGTMSGECFTDIMMIILFFFNYILSCIPAVLNKAKYSNCLLAKLTVIVFCLCTTQLRIDKIKTYLNEFGVQLTN